MKGLTVRRTLVMAGLVTALAAGGGGAAQAAADTSPPVLVSLVATTGTTVDVTNGSRPVTFEAKVRDATGVGAVQVNAIYEPDPSADPESQRSGEVNANPLTLVSGTAQDGTWRGQLTVPGGTRGAWKLYVYLSDTAGNYDFRWDDSLAAAGLVSRVTARTTAPPQAPSPITGKTTLMTGGPTNPWYVYFSAKVTWSDKAGSPVSTGRVVQSSSKDCGTLEATNTGPFILWPTGRNWIATCTVTFQTVNAAGRSPQTTFSFR